MHPISRTVPLLLLALCCLAPASAGAQSAPLAGLDAYIQQAMPQWEVPGFAIAVVKDDSVIFARGYGVRELGRPERVDENTLFAIASTTKAMTSAALGILADEGKLDWDDPVTQHLPGFQAGDSYVTRSFTIRDLLTHRSGLARNDNLWIASPFDRAEIIRRARFLPASGRFRADYGYHNIMYITAGETVGAVSGTSWDDFIDRRIFQPLGMTRSTTRMDTVAVRANVSASHTREDGKIIAAPPRDYDEIGGAGAVFSSAAEMAQWIRLQLAHGSYDGRRLIADSTVKEMHSPQTIIRPDSVDERLFPETNFQAYGLGWVVQDYKGRKLVHHSGYLNWTRTHVGLIPAEGIGVVAISNLSSSNLQRAVMHRVLDALLGEPPRDWSAEFLALSERGRERAAEETRKLEAARQQDTRPSLALARYAGSYTDDLYGEIEISPDNGHLVLRYSPDYVADLEHWHHDTFRAVWRKAGFGRSFITFSLDPRGRVAEMQLEDFGEFDRVRKGDDSG